MPKYMTFEEWSKEERELSKELNATPGFKEWHNKAWGSTKNRIIHAVNMKMPKKDAGLKDKCEEGYYDYLWKLAELHVRAYGDWPVYEMCEIETDDPVLDIYSPDSTPEKWAADRKSKKAK